MRKSIKASLLSALVFPGVGHFFLKKYIAALLLIATTSLSLFWLLANLVERALKIAEQIQAGQVQLEVESIRELILLQSSGSQAQLFNIVSLVLVILWGIAIVDSYRIGRQQDSRDREVAGREERCSA